jgi:hypothetical protein
MLAVSTAVPVDRVLLLAIRTAGLHDGVHAMA